MTIVATNDIMITTPYGEESQTYRIELYSSHREDFITESKLEGITPESFKLSNFLIRLNRIKHVR
jgi:hypothetical protein